MSRGLFITVEGVEGAGKSTNIAYIKELLTGYAPAVIETREPGGTQVSEAIREVLLAKDLPTMDSDTELLLMFAARAEHLQRKIIPALERGDWVVCDRFTDSTYAYQGGGRGVKLQRIAQLEQWVQGDLQPDLTVYFDVDASTGLSRVRTRGETDRFEEEDIAFFNRIRTTYLDLADQFPERYRVIDASCSLEQVQFSLKKTLINYLIERDGQ